MKLKFPEGTSLYYDAGGVEYRPDEDGLLDVTGMSPLQLQALLKAKFTRPPGTSDAAQHTAEVHNADDEAHAEAHAEAQAATSSRATLKMDVKP